MTKTMLLLSQLIYHNLYFRLVVLRRLQCSRTTALKITYSYKNTKFQELFNMHNPNKLSQHHRNILVVNVTYHYACPTLFSLPNPY